MKKKIGTSKSMKKMDMGGTSGPGSDLLPITAGSMRKTKVKERSADGNYVRKTVTRETPNSSTSSSKVRRTVQGFLEGAPRKDKFKSGGSVKKTSKKK